MHRPHATPQRTAAMLCTPACNKLPCHLTSPAAPHHPPALTLQLTEQATAPQALAILLPALATLPRAQDTAPQAQATHQQAPAIPLPAQGTARRVQGTVPPAPATAPQALATRQPAQVPLTWPICCRICASPAAVCPQSSLAILVRRSRYCCCVLAAKVDMPVHSPHHAAV